MPPPELPPLLGRIRALTTEYLAGRPESFEAFRELTGLLLRLTVLTPGGGVRLTGGPRARVRVLGGMAGPLDPVPLNDGRYLRIAATLFLADTPPPQGRRLKVERAGFQYQGDREGERWIFRYDYRRDPPAPHPGAHVQVRGGLAEDCLPPRTLLERLHFPTGRVSLEAVIRLLADGFGVPCNEPPAIWRPALTESERLFDAIAHRPLPGTGG